jgi:hypothetical protein
MKPINASVMHDRRARYAIRQPNPMLLVGDLTAGYSELPAVILHARRRRPAVNDVFPPAKVLSLTT